MAIIVGAARTNEKGFLKKLEGDNIMRLERDRERESNFFSFRSKLLTCAIISSDRHNYAQLRSACIYIYYSIAEQFGGIKFCEMPICDSGSFFNLVVAASLTSTQGRGYHTG